MRHYLAESPFLGSGVAIAACCVATVLAVPVGLWTDSTGWVLLTYFGSQFLLAGLMILGLDKWLWSDT